MLALARIASASVRCITLSMNHELGSSWFIMGNQPGRVTGACQEEQWVCGNGACCSADEVISSPPLSRRSLARCLASHVTARITGTSERRGSLS